MTNQTDTSKAPTHIAYVVRENGGKSFWSRIGCAWQHNDGNGFNADLEALPRDGKVIFRIRKEKPPQEG